MNRIFKNYIPGLSMGFSIIIILSAIINLLSGDTFDGFVYYIIEVAAFLIVAGFVDHMTGKIDFKGYIGSCVCEGGILYPISMLFAYLGHWFGMRLINIVIYTMIYAVIMGGIHYYFYCITKAEAKNINQYLSK